MYIPGYFSESNPDVLIKLINDYSFGLLVTTVDGRPYASHLPFLADGDSDSLILHGHLAKANPHWKSLENSESLAIFQGPHTYISPTWFQSRGVPTWNYAALHVYANVEIIHNIEEKRDIVMKLSDKFEQGRASPWIPDFDENLLNAIVGLRLSAIRVEGKFKLSQNKARTDQEGVINALQSSTRENDVGIARLMRKRLPVNSVAK